MHSPANKLAAAKTPACAGSKLDRNGDSKARSQVQAAVMADVIRRLVDAAPPLTAEQRDRLGVLLRGPGTEVMHSAARARGGAASSVRAKRKAGASG